MKLFKIACLPVGRLSIFLLCCILSAFSADPASEYPSACRTITANPTTTTDVVPGATNLIYQSKDGGQTWEDISQGLPINEQPEDFFAGESDVYLRVGDVMWHSKSNLNTPVWKIETGLFSKTVSIAFNRSGVMAFNYEGQIYQKTPAGMWLPIYANFKKSMMRTVFETSDGIVFLGSDSGLYKSSDHGQSWKQVQNEGWVMDFVESEGVLVATGSKGIMRSTDKGEHWQWVISGEGGVGIDVERIDGGFAAVSYSNITKSRRIRISLDNGKTWEAIDENLQPSLSISSIKQSGKYLLCGHPDGIFSSSDMGKTWNIVHPGVDKFKISIGDARNNPGRVFNLHVSGNIVYAVAKSAGC